jgi:hypothetical protein
MFLWEGTDEEFALYVRGAFSIPASLATVTITPRGSRRRSAVAISGDAGAIVFVLAMDPQSRKVLIAPYVMGALVSSAAVVERAKHPDGDADMRAITALGLRHLSAEIVLNLLGPQLH